MIFNMIAMGASAGGADTFAFLVVNYAAGAVCTATNRAITLTAPDTSGFVVFDIPAPATTPEQWTVTITDGTLTNSTNVSITAKGERVETTLMFYYTLFDIANNTPSEIAAGFSGTVFSFSQLGDYVDILCGGNGNYRESWTTPLPSDLSPYTNLVVYGYDRTGDARDKIGITQTAVNDQSDTWIASVATTNTTPQRLTTPLTSAMAGKYFTIRMNSGKNLYIQYVRLE